MTPRIPDNSFCRITCRCHEETLPRNMANRLSNSPHLTSWTRKINIAGYTALDVIPDKAHLRRRASADTILHFGPLASILLAPDMTRDIHFVVIPASTILLTPVHLPCSMETLPDSSAENAPRGGPERVKTTACILWYLVHDPRRADRTRVLICTPACGLFVCGAPENAHGVRFELQAHLLVVRSSIVGSYGPIAVWLSFRGV